MPTSLLAATVWIAGSLGILVVFCVIVAIEDWRLRRRERHAEHEPTQVFDLRTGSRVL